MLVIKYQHKFIMLVVSQTIPNLYMLVNKRKGHKKTLQTIPPKHAISIQLWHRKAIDNQKSNIWRT